MQLELLLLTSIFNSINKSAAIRLDNGLDKDLAFECGHGVEGVQFIGGYYGFAEIC